MRVVKSSKIRHKFFIKICAFVVAMGFFIVKNIELQININAKHKELQQLHEKQRVQDVKNQELREENQRNENHSEDVKKTARKRLDFAERSEKVFVNS